MATKLQGIYAQVETGTIAAVYAELDDSTYMDTHHQRDYKAISGRAVARAMSRRCLADPSRTYLFHHSLWICQRPTVKPINVPHSDINNRPCGPLHCRQQRSAHVYSGISLQRHSSKFVHDCWTGEAVSRHTINGRKMPSLCLRKSFWNQF
ncbi:uncharacterized protein ARMOST_18882 [Armillaria ostoyae]|uniref:Uncharacterized protein n=1 Tax=Armillaria ostoyae TaxID=47428 RepID=A0A284S326_ARMOS|nr:uncharacterized protein ARMOST_18882 [Armillaria ostoyae]